MTLKAVTAHQPVISIRISEALRSRLETLKEGIGHKTGHSVSTSEAAKQLLESARDHRAAARIAGDVEAASDETRPIPHDVEAHAVASIRNPRVRRGSEALAVVFDLEKHSIIDASQVNGDLLRAAVLQRVIDRFLSDPVEVSGSRHIARWRLAVRFTQAAHPVFFLSCGSQLLEGGLQPLFGEANGVEATTNAP